jgi:transcriptional activator of cad operon
MARFKTGEWTIDPDLGRITRGSEMLSLPPQVMQLLVFLARRPGQLISIDEMIDEVWHGRPMTSGSVYNSLNALRKAFGDDPGNPRYIETIPKRGYRLIAPVEFQAEQTTLDPDPVLTSGFPSKASGLKRFYKSRTGITVIGLSSLLIILWGVKDFQSGEPASRSPQQTSTERVSQPENDQRSIAVLPFLDLSPEKNQQYFSDGISEEILNLIARHPDLKVVGRTSSFMFRDQDQDLREIGRRLGVTHILEGSVRKDVDQLRITAQLIQADDGFHLWSKTYDAGVGSVFEVQDEIARSIAQELELIVLDNSRSGASSVARAPAELGAHELFLLARYRFNRGQKKDLSEAAELLDRAIELDPDYADAYVEKAYVLNGLNSRQTVNLQDNPAMQYVEMALALDPNLAGAYAMRGTMNHQAAVSGVGLPETSIRAEVDIKRALKLNPNHARALLWYSGVMRFQGQPWLHSVNVARRAIEIEPLWSYGAVYYLWLIRDLPAYREEKWRIIEEVISSDIAFALSPKEFRAKYHLFEGHLATAVKLFDATDDRENKIAKGYRAQAMVYLGEFQEFDLNEIPIFKFFDLLPLIPSGDDPDRNLCPLPEEIRELSESIEFCGLNYLRAGLTKQARSYLEEMLPPDIADFDAQFRHGYPYQESAALTLATLHTLEGEPERASVYLDLIEEFINGVSENGSLEATFLATTLAHVHALRGDHTLAIENLSKALDMGARDFGIFMHPAFNGLRDNPRFIAVRQKWLQLVNLERSDLDLQPLKLKDGVGAGEIPFEYVKKDALTTN